MEYEIVSGNGRNLKMPTTIADKSETSYTLQDLLCDTQYIIFVRGIIGLMKGSRDSNKVTASAPCQGKSDSHL